MTDKTSSIHNIVVTIILIVTAIFSTFFFFENRYAKIDINIAENILPKFEINKYTGSSSTTSSEGTAHCSSGYKVVSGGCSAFKNGTSQHNHIHKSAPTESFDGWHCKVTTDQDHTPNIAFVTVYSVCASEDHFQIEKGSGFD